MFYFKFELFKKKSIKKEASPLFIPGTEFPLYLLYLLQSPVKETS